MSLLLKRSYNSLPGFTVPPRRTTHFSVYSCGKSFLKGLSHFFSKFLRGFGSHTGTHRDCRFRAETPREVWVGITLLCFEKGGEKTISGAARRGLQRSAPFPTLLLIVWAFSYEKKCNSDQFPGSFLFMTQFQISCANDVQTDINSPFSFFRNFPVRHRIFRHTVGELILWVD